jgi:ElaA protein
MELCVKTFDELTADELYDLLALRTAVFVVEQQCPYQDADGLDRQALHVWLRDENGIRAYLRVMDRGVCGDEVRIGRVIAVERRQGLGSRVLAAGIKAAKERFRAETIAVEAQVYAKGLYEKQGFRTVSEEFLEDGIPHVKMVLTIRNP